MSAGSIARASGWARGTPDSIRRAGERDFRLEAHCGRCRAQGAGCGARPADPDLAAFIRAHGVPVRHGRAACERRGLVRARLRAARLHASSGSRPRASPSSAKAESTRSQQRIDRVRTGDAPVFLGEFGASRWARGVDDYYAARIAACEARGIGWAAFPLADAGCGLRTVGRHVQRGDGRGRDDRPALDTLRPAWARNALRPGGLACAGELGCGHEE